MVLIISPVQIQTIYRHAEQIYPEECCGILLGTMLQGSGFSSLRDAVPNGRLTPTRTRRFSSLRDAPRTRGFANANATANDRLSKTVVEVIPTANVWIKPDSIYDPADLAEISRTKNSRYTIDPQAIFRATKRGRNLQLEIVGFFHSHPDYPAVPSICDRDLAWDVYSYPIVSVVQGKVNDFKSWVLDNQGIFQQEEIQ